MNREIKFRGKEDGGKWFYGYLTISKLGRYAINFQSENGTWHDIRVIPETVGQFTGECDVCGVDIYEGDILEYEEIDYENDDKFKRQGVVDYSVAGFSPVQWIIVMSDIDEISCKVIGNIHDNPELL